LCGSVPNPKHKAHILSSGGKIVKKGIIVLAVLLCWLLIFFNCANYKITHKLEQPINQPSNCSIGEIRDQLPADFDEDDKPSLEHIDKFKDYLRIALIEKGIFRDVLLMNPEFEYQVTGGILDFKKGSGFVRFLGLFGAGNAKVTATLRLEDRNTDEILFAGNFKQEVSSYMESGDKIFERVAKDFAKELSKQIKKLKEGK
jgi:hypothetical protein